ncbi:hypothetical protein RhiJN_09467 [Ceratobasidium sp. AG-Ba]|nr:hypothetical protein RhiJN_09467 [Ceratobasidium sp. AG-Ba]QRW10260.1 hypothetical protein RhiLY_09259 [Ceratobasidium sp. AG-Ba]
MSTKGYTAARVRAIFELPQGLRYLCAEKLAYVDQFYSPSQVPEPDVGLYTVTHALRDGIRVSAVVPLTSIKMTCHLAPRFAQVFTSTSSPATSSTNYFDTGVRQAALGNTISRLPSNRVPDSNNGVTSKTGSRAEATQVDLARSASVSHQACSVSGSAWLLARRFGLKGPLSPEQRAVVLPQPAYPSRANLIPSPLRGVTFVHARFSIWKDPTVSSLRDKASPALSTPLMSTIHIQSSTPSLTYYTESKSGSDTNVWKLKIDGQQHRLCAERMLNTDPLPYADVVRP